MGDTWNLSSVAREYSPSGELCDSVPASLLMNLHFLDADPPLLHEPCHLLPREPGLLLQLRLQRLHLDRPEGRGVHFHSTPAHFSPLTASLSPEKQKSHKQKKQMCSSKTNRRKISTGLFTSYMWPQATREHTPSNQAEHPCHTRKADKPISPLRDAHLLTISLSGLLRLSPFWDFLVA